MRGFARFANWLNGYRTEGEGPQKLRRGGQHELDTKESKAVGFKGANGSGRGESVGHASGRRIVTILGKKKDDLTDDDYAHMRKVVGYVRRHLAQEPANVATSRWRYSLMNWGHDPLR